MAIEFNDRRSHSGDRRHGELVSLGEGEAPLDPTVAIPHIENLRAGLLEYGHPKPNKVNKHADRAIDYINSAVASATQKVGPTIGGYQNDMEQAHTHVDKLNDMAYYDGDNEHRDLAEKIQEHISKSY